MGGTAIKLVRNGFSVLFVDLCEGEPARHAARGERHKQAVKAAAILGVERTTLTRLPPNLVHQCANRGRACCDFSHSCLTSMAVV